jgi:hypothetical protein
MKLPVRGGLVSLMARLNTLDGPPSRQALAFACSRLHIAASSRRSACAVSENPAEEGFSSDYDLPPGAADAASRPPDAAFPHDRRVNHDATAVGAAAAVTVAVKAAAAAAGDLLNDVAIRGRNGRGRHGIGGAKAGDGGSKQCGSEQFFHGRIPLL